jgi:CheY-like chemotaxis protein
MSTLTPVDVLIVDDDLDIVDALRDALEDEGFTIAVAYDGEEALGYLEQAPAPSMILLDSMMPRCDGATFRERQRANPKIAGIPVVLLTADMRAKDRMAQIDAHVLLHKPVVLKDLLTLVRRLTGRPE